MENKTGKYFKYAFGEIILVVIGILIALQINNWNENRKNKIKEKRVPTASGPCASCRASETPYGTWG